MSEAPDSDLNNCLKCGKNLIQCAVNSDCDKKKNGGGGNGKSSNGDTPISPTGKSIIGSLLSGEEDPTVKEFQKGREEIGQNFNNILQGFGNIGKWFSQIGECLGKIASNPLSPGNWLQPCGLFSILIIGIIIFLAYSFLKR